VDFALSRGFRTLNSHNRFRKWHRNTAWKLGWDVFGAWVGRFQSLGQSLTGRVSELGWEVSVLGWEVSVLGWEVSDLGWEVSVLGWEVLRAWLGGFSPWLGFSLGGFQILTGRG